MSLKNKIIFVFNPDDKPSGKSTLSLLIANCIHYKHKQDVTLISCDPLERFVRKFQLRDEELFRKNDAFASNFKEKGRTPVLSVLETGEANIFHLLNDMKEDDDETLIVIDCKHQVGGRVLQIIDIVADFVIIPTDISQFAYKFGCFYAHCFAEITDNKSKYMLLRNQVKADSEIDYPTELHLHSNIKDLEYPEIIKHSPDILNDPLQYNSYFWSENELSLQISKITDHIIEKIK